MTMSANIEPFDPHHNDRALIEEGKCIPCRICFEWFARVRLTWRYCSVCSEGFCEGEHGVWPGRSVAYCLKCIKHRDKNY